MNKWESEDLGDFWVLEFRTEAQLRQAIDYLTQADVAQRWEMCAGTPIGIERASSGRLYAVCGAVAALIVLVVWGYITQVDEVRLITQGRAQGASMWLAYVVPVFECLILGAGVGCMVGFLKTAGLPKWYDRANECEFFKMKTEAGYYLFLESGVNDEHLLGEMRPMNQALMKKEGEV